MQNHLVKANFVASWSGVGTWRYSGFHFRYVRAGSSSLFFTASATWLRMHSCGVRWSLWAGKDSGAIWARLRQRYWFPSRSLNHSRKTGDVGEEKWGSTPAAKALASGSLSRLFASCESKVIRRLILLCRSLWSMRDICTHGLVMKLKPVCETKKVSIVLSVIRSHFARLRVAK